MDRRQMMIGGAALFGTSAVGGVLVASNDSALRGWIEDAVVRHLPGVRIEPRDLERFSAAKVAELGSNPNYRIYAASLSTGVDVSAFSKTLRDKVETLERKTVSDFLLRSNFFALDDPAVQTVTYDGDGPQACQNPFAVFD
jgi:hypothetical protein